MIGFGFNYFRLNIVSDFDIRISKFKRRKYA